jgi:hypothetical protein
LRLIHESEKSAAEQSVIKSLKFDMMRARHENIELAHQRTFDWIFEDASTSLFPHAKFVEWLQIHNDIFG